VSCAARIDRGRSFAQCPVQSISVIIPCYNEEDRLPRTLRETVRFFSGRQQECVIIVVSDGSKDNTREIAGATLQNLPKNITGRVIEYSPNEGKGKAVKIGMLAATSERVLFMDADYAVPLEDLVKAEQLLDAGCDIAIGSRALEDTKLVERQSFIRERMSKLFGWIQRNYLGLKLLDTQCGFKLFTHKAAHDIFEHVTLTSVIFDGEMLWLAKRLGFRVREFPVQWTHDQDSRITYSPMRALKVFGDMLRIPFLHVRRR
jgi:dolichyl-phosphate beta-glucosyltransferase